MIAPVEPRRKDESMTLLREMMERPLDPSYAAAAAAREAAGQPGATRFGTPLVTVAFLLVGLLLVTAAMELRTSSTAATRARADLIGQIEDQRSAAEARSAQVQKLRAEISTIQDSILAEEEQDALAEELRRLELVSGGAPVSGPGLRITLDDPAEDNGEAPAEGEETNKVLPRDLQLVANGLWASGAEAMAINGHRLTSRSAIRSAGEAILVNFRPLVPPYVIESIGDPKALETGLMSRTEGGYLVAIQQNYGVRVVVESADRLQLPSATSLTIRVAENAAADLADASAPRTTTPTATTPTATTPSTTTPSTTTEEEIP